MKSVLTALATGILVAASQATFGAGAFGETADQIAALQEQGELAKAEQLAAEALAAAGDIAPADRRALEFEIERSRRIRDDYRLTEERLLRRLDDDETGLRDFTRADFDAWMAEGRFDTKIIDGERRFANSTVANLSFRYPDIRARRLRTAKSEWEPFLRDHVRSVVAETRANGTAYGKPRRFDMKFTVSVRPGVVPAGETIRCWLPFPQQFASQEGIELRSASPAAKWLARADQPMRSIHFEQPSAGDGETVFTVDYSLTTLPRRFEIDPSVVKAGPPWSDPGVAYFAEERAPHLAFTPELRALEAKIAAGETNPAVKARKYYDWCAENLRYSYAREYSTLRNISMFVCENGYGDCGQIALTYMALCRIGGIPARWQSGWMIYPMYVNMHDWCEIWLEPYGWVPVDANYAVDSLHTWDDLTDAERTEIRDFFFGGMDAYRLVANRDHGIDLYPPKESFRSDTVDFQRGELEAGGKNIYYGDFAYSLDAKPIE